MFQCSVFVRDILVNGDLVVCPVTSPTHTIVVPKALTSGTPHLGDNALLSIDDSVTPYSISSITIQATAIAAPGYQQTASKSQSVNALSTASIVINWPLAWSDANYSVAATLEGSASLLGDITILGVTDKTATQVTVAVQNASITAKTANVTVIGVKL